MEERANELIDYLRVIWKRKILIIVVTLVGIGIGVGAKVKELMSKRLPVTEYRAEAVIEIGQKVAMGFTTPSLIVVEKPVDMKAMLTLWYDEITSKGSRYNLDVEQIGTLSLLRLTVGGPDKEVEKVLTKIIDKLIVEHKKETEYSAGAYKNYIKKLEADASMISENINMIETTIVKMKNKEKQFIKYMDKSQTEQGHEEAYIGDRSVIWNMLYLKTIDKEIDLSRSRANLRNIQWQLLVHRTTIGNIEDYSTRLVGEIRSTAIVKPKKEESLISIIIVAGVVGLIMSLFIAFLTEYIEESKLRKKGK